MSNKRPTILGTVLIAIIAFSIVSYGVAYISKSYDSHGMAPHILKFAIGIIGIVWLFSLMIYNKLSDVTNLPHLDYRQHRNIDHEITTRLHWFWLRAVYLAVLATVMYMPTIMLDVRLPIPHYMIGAGAGALTLALISLYKLWGELEEIRSLQSYIKELERIEYERNAQITDMNKTKPIEWESDSNLNGFR